jgi:hypothetical protein
LVIKGFFFMNQERSFTMPHTHAASKAEAIHDALEVFQEEHHHVPDSHEKARLVSDTIKEWEHEHVEVMHSADNAA